MYAEATNPLIFFSFFIKMNYESFINVLFFHFYQLNNRIRFSYHSHVTYKHATMWLFKLVVHHFDTFMKQYLHYLRNSFAKDILVCFLCYFPKRNKNESHSDTIITRRIRKQNGWEFDFTFTNRD